MVYTPNEVVKFMLESTNYLQNLHFGKEFEDEGVEILDPATGTGTFICDLIDYIRKDKLPHKYRHEIHANEVAILPYYIANLNSEYTYKQRTGNYAEFKNLCFVDTLDNTEFLVFSCQESGKAIQASLFGFTAENVERIKNQNSKRISVIIGNPPYNAKQENYNYQNANKAYAGIDQRIRDTYIKHGTAQNQIVLYDMYVRFYRWATDRLFDDGIIAMITNRSFIEGRTFDGFRKCIEAEFDHAYIVDTNSDVRANPKISGTGHNIFGIQAGVAVLFLVKLASKKTEKRCRLQYVALGDFMPREQKLDWFAKNRFENIDFQKITPDAKHNWLNLTDNDFDDLLPLISKESKTAKAGEESKSIFKLFSRGVASQRDEWVYDFSRENLETKVRYFANIYQETLNHEAQQRHLAPHERNPYPQKFDIKWDRELDTYLQRGVQKEFEPEKIVESLYRPFVKKYFYFDRHFNGMTYQWYNIIPKDKETDENVFMGFNGLGMDKPFYTLTYKTLVDVQCFPNGQNVPLYYYDDAGKRQENITDWAVAEFRQKYSPLTPDGGIKKEDIFFYVYAVLHHPAYLKKYEQNLKRDFPRIPLYDDFEQWAAWGKKLVELHSPQRPNGVMVRQAHHDKEQRKCQTEPVEVEESTVVMSSPNQSHYDIPNILKVVKLNLPKPTPKLKADKEAGEIVLTDACTLRGVPAEAWEYKLGNRSAIEWVLDQYRERKEGIEIEGLKPYRFADYETEVISLLQHVCYVSVETVKILREMPSSTSSL